MVLNYQDCTGFQRTDAVNPVRLTVNTFGILIVVKLYEAVLAHNKKACGPIPAFSPLASVNNLPQKLIEYPQ